MKNELSASLKKVEDLIENNGMVVGDIKSIVFQNVDDYNEKAKEKIGSDRYCLISLSVVVPLVDQETFDKSQ